MRRTLALLAGAATVLLATPAAAISNPGGTGSPGVAAPELDAVFDREVFETGPAGDVIRWRVGDSATSRSSIGGYATSGPAATLRADGWTTVVVRGRDGAVWMTERQRSGPWPAWRSLGGATTDRPAIDVAGTVHVRGTDGVLWQRARGADGTFSAWRSTGRRIAGGPGAGSYRDPDGGLWRRVQYPDRWEQVPALPNGVRPVSEPFSFVYGTAGLLVRGSDGQCWELDVLEGWRARGGRFVSGFSGAGQSDGVVGAFWTYGRGTDGRLYESVGTLWRLVS